MEITIPTLLMAIRMTITIFCSIANITVINGNDFEILPPINNPRTADISEYRGIKLANGLQVLLITDNEGYLKSGAALAVRIGVMNDIKERPGIANLLRYLLLVANGKHSKKHEFKRFIQKYRGKLDTDFTYYNNDAEHKQNFSFEVDSDFLPQALVRFAQCFIDPLFQEVDKTALKGILRASLTKHDRLMSTNKMRVNQLLKSLSEEGHPYRNLTFGTVEMLNKYAGVENEPLDDILNDFYSNWYSANLMRMVVWGIEDLDTLEEMVETSFTKIKNNNAEKLVFSDEQHPWKSNQLGHKIYIVPVEDKIRIIQLTFRAPDVLHQYKISPERYTIQFFKHRGPGTLGFILQKKGLCKHHSLHAEYQVYAGIGFFTIMMDLTEAGLKKVDYILGLTFQYIYLLKNKGVLEWFYNENRQLDELNFENQSTQICLSMIQSLASAMHDYPIQDILTYKFIRDPFDRAAIDEFLSYLRPDKVNISVIDKSYKEEANYTEPWYGTKYKIEKLPPRLLQEWDSPSDLYPELGIPTPNEFIPSDDTNVNGIPELNEYEPRYPSIIYTSSLSRIWHKYEGGETSALTIIIEIACPLANVNPMDRFLMNVFVRMLNFSLEEYEHFAAAVLIAYEIIPTSAGIQVKVTGTNRVPILLERILSRMLNFEKELKEEDFERGKKKEQTYSLNFLKTEDSYATALFHASSMRNQSRWGIREVISMTKIRDVKYERMKKIPGKLLSRIYIQGLIQGHCDEEKATQIANTIDRLFAATSHGVLPQEILHPRIVQMDFGKQYVIHAHGNSPKNYYYAYFPFSSAYTIRNYTIGHLILDINIEACNKILPPEEMGTSECEIEMVNNFFGLVIKISSQMHPHLINIRVERFFEVIHMNLQNISSIQFSEHKSNLNTYIRIANEVNKDFPYHNFYWKEIRFHNYDFEMLSRQEEILDLLRKEEVLDFFQETFIKGAPKRRKLAVYLFSRSLTRSMSEDIAVEEINRDGIQSTKIENILQYKNSSILSPTAVPDLVYRR